MEMIQTEIRQPHSLPVSIFVPEYERLASMKVRVQCLKGEAVEYGAQIAALTRESIALSQQSQTAAADSPIFVRLAEIKRDISRLETKSAEAQSQANRVEDEHRQWCEQFAWNLYRRQLLARELAEMNGAGPITQMLTTSIGKARPRTKLEILIDLEQAVTWLAAFSNEPDLAREAATVQAQLAEAYKQS